MSRKRLTQIFPFLLPLRRWQRKKLFYIKMRFDGNRYAKEIRKDMLPCKVFGTSSLMLNKNSGFDMKYQQNKVFNLKLAAKTLNHVVIKPGETFFSGSWQDMPTGASAIRMVLTWLTAKSWAPTAAGCVR